MKALRSPGYEFGPYRLDTVGRSLECQGEVIALPPKAVEVLAELVKRPGEVVAKKELLETVWPKAFVEEANLNQMVFVLRRAIESTNGSEYITTVPRRGYRFSGAVRKVEIPCRIDSIAVLPLANLSGDPSQEYFADGITEALITELAKIGSLRVVSRTSVMRYKGKDEPIAQIARALRVRGLLEGSVVKSGDRFRITVQLIHAGSDQHLWTEVYDGAMADVLEVQSKVARDVAAGIRAQLSRGEKARLTISRKVSPEAYSLYLKGRYFARILTEEGQRKAILHFQRSIQCDPDYAPSYAGLAECLIELAYFFGMNPKKAFAEAKPAALKAVALDEEFAEGHAALGLLRLLDDWDWEAADAETGLAIELAPGNPYVYWKRGVFLRYAGRCDESIPIHLHAESLDPFSILAITEVGYALYYARRFGEASKQIQKAIELEPTWDQLYFGLGLTLLQQERFEEAISALRTAVQKEPGNAFSVAALIYGLGHAGRKREAESHLDQLMKKYEYVPCWFLAMAWVGLNDKERALEALEQAFRDHEPCMVSLKVDAIFDPLRKEKRFKDMVRSVGPEPR
jgi:TolB-like protein/tetratricopeptide (TPR) repeat protein